MEGEGGGGEVVTGQCAEADIAAFYQAIAENDTQRMAELLTQCPLLRHLLATAGRFLRLSPSLCCLRSRAAFDSHTRTAVPRPKHLHEPRLNNRSMPDA
jgi:hypothetical protein